MIRHFIHKNSSGMKETFPYIDNKFRVMRVVCIISHLSLDFFVLCLFGRATCSWSWT